MVKVKRILETYGAAFGVYREFSLPAGPVRAIDLAQRLREAGLPAQAYRLANKVRARELGFPLIYSGGDSALGWRLYLPPGLGAYGLEEKLLLSGDQVLDEEGMIVGEPPVGHRFQVIEHQPAARAPITDHEVDIFIFYAATNDKPELFKEQLRDELTELLELAQRTGREPIFIDACGLIPEETVKGRQTGGRDEKEAFAIVFREIAQETEGIGRGHAPYEPNSPFWSELYRFLAERRIRSVLEEMDYELWKRIVDFDRRQLLEKAFTEFLSGFPEEAAQTMLQHMRGFHELNCLERDRRLAQQVKRLIEDSGRPLVLIGRELGHYGVLEGLLSDKYSVHSKILGEERLPVLLRQPALETNLLWNIGVELDEAELELKALRYCLKAIVLQSASAVRDLRATAELLDSSRIDLLSRDEIEQLIEELYDPTRIYLRSRGQDIVTQLLYLLKDRGIIPEEIFEALQGR